MKIEAVVCADHMISIYSDNTINVRGCTKLVDMDTDPPTLLSTCDDTSNNYAKGDPDIGKATKRVQEIAKAAWEVY